MYEELTNLINNSEHVNFGGINGRKVSDEWIKKAEQKLNVSLPPSYKWWLKNYGGGEINGEEIFSIYEQEFEDAVGGDIVYIALVNRQNNIFSQEKLFICDPGNDEAWYFDLNQKDLTGEYPVYVFDYQDNSSNLYAKDFVDFLMKRIQYNN